MNESAVFLSPCTLPAFRNWLAEAGFCKNTLLSYNFRIDGYLNYQRTRTSETFPEISLKSALQYLEYLTRQSVSASTRNVTIAALSKFFEYLGLDFSAPGRVYDSSDKNTSLTTEQTSTFLQVSLSESSLKARVIALLCFHVDLSASQCLALNKDDITLDDTGRCFVYARKRNELVELHGDAKGLVVCWYWYARHQDNKSEALFLSDQGSRISRSGIDYLIKSIGISAHLMLSARVLQNSGRAYRKRLSQQSPKLREMIPGLNRGAELIHLEQPGMTNSWAALS